MCVCVCVCVCVLYTYTVSRVTDEYCAKARPDTSGMRLYTSP